MHETTDIKIEQFLDRAAEYGGFEGLCNRLDGIYDSLDELKTIKNQQAKIVELLSTIEQTLRNIEANTETSLRE